MILLHVLLLVYWLGADVGTFYASRFVADPGLSTAARATAAKIMLGVDLLPRLAMPLTLATGLHLALARGAWPVAGGVGGWTAAAWALSAVWLAGVLALHHGAGKGPKPWLARLVRLDWAFRVLLVMALLLTAGAALWRGTPALPTWLAWKLLAFAATVVCGLMIRLHLRPFGAAFGQLMREGSSPAVDTVIQESIAACKPYVLVIWGLLVFSAAAGLHLI